MKTCCAILAIACAGLAMNASAADAEKTMQFKDLPAAVQSAARGVIGPAKVIRAGEELEGGVIYSVQYEAGGKKFEVEISPEGKVRENAELIEVAAAPDAVRKKIEEKTKGALFVKTEKTGNGQESIYIVEFTGNNGGEGKLKIDSQGKVISEEHGD